MENSEELRDLKDSNMLQDDQGLHLRATAELLSTSHRHTGILGDIYIQRVGSANWASHL